MSSLHILRVLIGVLATQNWMLFSMVQVKIKCIKLTLTPLHICCASSTTCDVLFNFFMHQNNEILTHTRKLYFKQGFQISRCVLFLHSPFCKAEGLCQQAAIRKGGTTRDAQNWPIGVKQINWRCPGIGWHGSCGLSHIQKLFLQYNSIKGKAGTIECTVVQSSCAQSKS